MRRRTRSSSRTRIFFSTATTSGPVSISSSPRTITNWSLPDYFKGDKRAALASPDGAHLTGDIVNALAGHTQFAQADGSASAAKVIGHVTKLTGNATVIRNGVSIILNLGDNVNQGDVVQSGSNSTLGITFIDGSVFGLGSNAKMVLNEMIYDPNGSSNSSLLSLVQGTISFVAGATAKHGDMKVDTPVATMGIRGTAVLVEIDFEVPGVGRRTARPVPGAGRARRHQRLLCAARQGHADADRDRQPARNADHRQRPGHRQLPVVGAVVAGSAGGDQQGLCAEIHRQFESAIRIPSSPTSVIPQNTFIQLASGDIVNVRLLYGQRR